MLQVRQALTDRSFVDKLIGIAGHIDSENGRDIAQEAFLEMIEGWQEFETEKDLIKKFCQMARKYKKQQQRYAARLVTLDEAPERIQIDNIPDLDVREALDALSPDLKTIVNFRLRGKTRTEIAAYLDISRRSVSRQLSTARK